MPNITIICSSDFFESHVCDTVCLAIILEHKNLIEEKNKLAVPIETVA